MSTTRLANSPSSPSGASFTPRRQLLAGDIDAAAETLRHTLSITERAGNLDMAGEALLGMADVAARRGQLELAARLTGAATTDSTPQAVSERIVWSRLHEHVIAAAQAR